MKAKPNILVLLAALASMLTATNQAQTTNPPYLSQFPSVERVKAEVKGTDTIDTAQRLVGTFVNLRVMIKNLAGAQLGRTYTPDEKRLIDEYSEARRRLDDLMPPPDSRDRWYKLQSFYLTNQGFKEELWERFFSPEFRAFYYRVTGKQPPQLATSEPTTPPTAQPGATERASATLYKTQADKYRHAEDFAKAIDAYKRAITIDPSYASPYVDLALCYFHTGQWRLVIATFQKYETLGKMEPALLCVLGYAHRELKEYDEALKILRSIIALQPEAVDLEAAHFGIGKTYSDMGQYQNAVLAFETALRIDPNDGTVFAELGLSYLGLRQYPKALAAMQQAIRLEPKNGKSFQNLGYIYLLMGKKQEALEAYRTLLMLDKEMAQQLYADINK